MWELKCWPGYFAQPRRDYRYHSTGHMCKNKTMFMEMSIRRSGILHRCSAGEYMRFERTPRRGNRKFVNLMMRVLHAAGSRVPLQPARVTRH